MALFALPLVLGALLLFALPLPRTLAWHFVRADTHGRGLWIRDRVFSSPVAIDVAFFGTSATWYGVDDEAIERDLQRAGRPLHVVNFGYGRSGRNLDYVIARDLLETRQVRHLIVEVRNDEHKGSHPLFGYVAPTDDLLSAPLLTDAEYFVDAYRGVNTRVAALRDRLLDAPGLVSHRDVAPHGVLRYEVDRVERSAVLDRAWQRRHERAASRGAPGGSRTRRPRRYVRAIAELAARHGAQVHFLYLPTYGYPWAELAYRDLYEELGDLWFPPEEIFRNKAHWRDTNHLNPSGQAPLAAWLAARVAGLD